MSDQNPKLRNRTLMIATKDEVSCKLGNEAAILGLKNSVYYGLNPVGARVWELLRHPRSLEEICNTIVSEYDVSAERAERDLLHFLDGMLAEGLIELSAPDHLPQTRREIST